MRVSISSIQDFLSCRRLYYYKRVKKYFRDELSFPHLVGKVMHVGVYNLLRGSKDYIKETMKYLDQEKKEIQSKFSLSAEDQEELNEIDVQVKGMLEAYKKKYAIMLRDVKVISNEQERELELDGGDKFIYKIDNIIDVRGKRILHELKTSKYITPDYVKSIRTSFQSAAYFYAYNIDNDDNPVQEILYDIIRKPGIWQKKNEPYGAFLKRLGEWYDQPDNSDRFHVERFEKPVISEDDIWNTVINITRDLKKMKKKEDFYQDFEKCHSYYGNRCPYYELCHEGGESKENLVLYQIGRQ
jgi:hypothetical protein